MLSVVHTRSSRQPGNESSLSQLSTDQHSMYLHSTTSERRAQNRKVSIVMIESPMCSQLSSVRVIRALQAEQQISTVPSSPHSPARESPGYQNDARSDLYLNCMDLSRSNPSALSPGDSTPSAAFETTDKHAGAEIIVGSFAEPSIDYELAMPSLPVLFPDHAPSMELPPELENAFPGESHSALQDVGLSLSKEDLLAEVALFTVESYECYPILDLHNLVKRIEEGKHLADPEFRTLILSVVAMNEARKFRRFPGYGTTRLDSILATVRNIRLNSANYHFADAPSLDTVTVSWCLFMANIFRGRFYRAFAYLTEAIGFLDLIDQPSDHLEAARLRRLEYMIYITESGAISLYGPPRKRRIARWPSDYPDVVEDLLFHHEWEGGAPGEWVQSLSESEIVDKRAVELLLLMARLHAAAGPDEVANVTVDEKLMASIAGSYDQQPKKCTAISEQTADVAITRQWKLGSHWRTKLAKSSPLVQHSPSLNYTVQILGMTALQWGKTLLPGALRLVGVGKIVALADALLYISSKIGEPTSCTNIIGDLIQMVSDVDYERNYAAQLYLLQSSMLTVPPMIQMDDFGSTEVRHQHIQRRKQTADLI